MDNIEKIIEGIELTDEQKKQITDGVAKNYRTIVENEAKSEKLKEATEKATALEKQLADVGEKVAELDGKDAKVSELEKQLADYEAEKVKAAEEAKASEAAKAFEAEFDKAHDGREFTSDFVRKSLMNEAMAAHAANPLKGISEIVNEIAKDTDGIYKNPQTPPPANLPNPNGGDAAAEGKPKMKTFF